MVAECILPLINVELKRETHHVSSLYGGSNEVVGKQWVELTCGLGPPGNSLTMSDELIEALRAGECEVVIRPKRPVVNLDAGVTFIQRSRDAPQTQENIW